MKSISTFVIAVLLTSTIASFAGQGAYENYEDAKKAAAKNDIPILLEFSGSDWCGWCIRLNNEVFSKKAFTDFAGKEVAYYVADFPSRKEIPAEQKKRNEELASQYGIEGFPTVLLVDKNGKVLARTGYKAGGPDAYVKHLRSLIKSSDK